MSLKLRTRATLLIAVTFSALLATFLLLTFFVVKRSFESRTIEEMRSQLRAILHELPPDPTPADVEQLYHAHGRTGESALAISVWTEKGMLAAFGADTMTRFLPTSRIPAHRVDTTYDINDLHIVYALREGHYWGAAVMSEQTTEEIVEEMVSIFDLVLVIGIVLSILVASALSRLALDPISKLTTATQSLLERKTNTSSRLPVPKGPQEAEALAERFNQILEERDQSIDTLKSFTADVAHELRSPLTIMRGELEVELRSNAATPSQRETLESALEEVQHLSGIVDDLLYLARLENSADILSGLVDVSIVERVKRQVERLNSAIEKKALRVVLEIDPTLSVRAHPSHLDRLLYNLILNAVQYSHSNGEIQIASSGRELSIRDHGIGIETAALARVTDRFYRADPSRNRGQGNVGLGLAIAQGIARRYDIGLDLQSELGKGTTVLLRFPSAH
jgi:two-component system, OmpR family, heavy metal sensor histidine kinase CusS